MSECEHNENNAEYCVICLRAKVEELIELIDSTINELRGLCRCADEVRCERKLEIERLTAELADCKESDRLIERLIVSSKASQARVKALEGALNKLKNGQFKHGSWQEEVIDIALASEADKGGE